MNFGSHFFERDIFAISRKDTYDIMIKEMILRPRGLYGPWFAIAFKAGQQHRLSPSWGGMCSGHLPPAPGWPSGVTCPTLRLGVTRLYNTVPKSQVKTPTSLTTLAIGVIRNMGIMCSAHRRGTSSVLYRKASSKVWMNSRSGLGQKGSVIPWRDKCIPWHK